MSSDQEIMVFAHRGFSSRAPENTMDAFQEAVHQGIPGIELDVHRCASGELVVFHDDHVRRITGAEGIVDQMDFQDLRRLDAGTWMDSRFSHLSIPLLEEVLDAFGTQCYWDIELKSRRKDDFGLAEGVVNLIQAYRLEQHCTISSFNPLQLRFAEAHLNLPTAVIFAKDPEVPWYLRKGAGRLLTKGNILKPEHIEISEKWMKRFHGRRGYDVWAWTVDEEQDILRMIELGVQAVITNYPERAMALIREHSAAHLQQSPQI